MKFFLLGFFFLLTVPAAAGAQTRRATPPNPDDTRLSETGDPVQDINLPPEMRARLAIERAENEHRKVLEDVRKLSDLSGELAAAWEQRGSLSPDDMKRVSGIEKLAKRVLSHAGGNEVDDKDGASRQMTVAEAIKQINAAAEKISRHMTAETRHVISATVIANANEIIGLAQYLRRAGDSR